MIVTPVLKGQAWWPATLKVQMRSSSVLCLCSTEALIRTNQRSFSVVIGAKDLGKIRL